MFVLMEMFVAFFLLHKLIVIQSVRERTRERFVERVHCGPTSDAQGCRERLEICWAHGELSVDNRNPQIDRIYFNPN